MITLFALFPIVSLSLLAVVFRRQGFCGRSALMSAAVAWGAILTIITEILSILHRLNFLWLSIAWGLVIIILTCLFSYVGRIKPAENIYSFTIFTKFLLMCIAIIIATTGIIAVIAPPNTWDSMTYHMSRVMHWIQNQSVAHYPTSILRQIELTPWAEFAITNLQILSGGDFLANLVQWFCMVGCITGVTLVAKKMGASHRAQVYAAVVAATIPTGILQSSSTKNDCVVSFWLVCLVYFGIQFNEKPRWSYASAVGASLGLALLSKGTAYVYAIPLSLCFAIYSFKYIKLLAVKYIVFIMLIAVSLNFGHYIRNYETFGNILSSGKTKYSNDIHSLASVVSNITRNMALEAGSPFMYANHIIKSGVNLLHVEMGLGINDKRTTWPGTAFDVVASRHEDLAGNPLHLLLIISSIIAVWCSKKLKQQQYVSSYIVALVMAFILFCFYLRWQPWHNRLLLPLIILWSPIVALMLAEIKQAWVANTILLAICVTALPYLLLNKTRPLISNGNTASIFSAERNSQYFNDSPALKQNYYFVAQFLKNINCSNLALEIGEDTWEYPLWILLHKEFGQNIRIEHINVDNLSGNIPIEKFNYCFVLK